MMDIKQCPEKRTIEQNAVPTQGMWIILCDEHVGTKVPQNDVQQTYTLSFLPFSFISSVYSCRSGCVKSAIGVIATSTCGNTCGTSCRRSESNPGEAYGYSPSTFCIFGERVKNMPYCPAVAAPFTVDNKDGLGKWSCKDNDKDSTGDNSICCADTTHKGEIGDSVNGVWNCGAGGEGDPLCYAQGWNSSDPNDFMCIINATSTSSRWVNGTSSHVCSPGLTCQLSQSP